MIVNLDDQVVAGELDSPNALSLEDVENHLSS